MALDHALLVALSEQPSSGLDLTRRFARSIGYFWPASHQQIYKVLGRMESEGWLEVTEVVQTGRPDKKVYAVTPAGADALAAWLATPTGVDAFRSEIAVKLRGASYGDRAAVLATVRDLLADHTLRLDHYTALAKRQFPDPGALHEAGREHELDQYLVLRGGVRLEEFWVGWLTEYLEAHDRD